ncbi:MAG: hypothetical protein AB1696_29000 [Planctomycetota bacterium]
MLVPLSCVMLCGSDERHSGISHEITKYLAEEDWPRCSEIIGSWHKRQVHEREAIIDQLCLVLSSRKRCSLKNTSKLIVGPRVGSGEIGANVFGYYVSQDLLIEGGKAAFAIESLVGTFLPAITEKLSPEETKYRILMIGWAVKAYKRGVRDGRNDAALSEKKPEQKEVE